MRLHELPTEIILSVLESLDYTSKCALRLTNQILKIRVTPVLFQRLSLIHRNESTTNDAGDSSGSSSDVPNTSRSTKARIVKFHNLKEVLEEVRPILPHVKYLTFKPIHYISVYWDMSAEEFTDLRAQWKEEMEKQQNSTAQVEEVMEQIIKDAEKLQGLTIGLADYVEEDGIPQEVLSGSRLRNQHHHFERRSTEKLYDPLCAAIQKTGRKISTLVWDQCDFQLSHKPVDPYLFLNLKSLCLSLRAYYNTTRTSVAHKPWPQTNIFTHLITLSLPTLEQFEVEYYRWGDYTDFDSLDFPRVVGPVVDLGDVKYCTVFPRLKFFKLVSLSVSSTILAGFLENQPTLTHVVMDSVYLFDEEGSWQGVASRMSKSIQYWDTYRLRHMSTHEPNQRLGFMYAWTAMKDPPNGWEPISSNLVKQWPVLWMSRHNYFTQLQRIERQ